MAKLFCINQATKRPNNNIGDIVCIMPDEYQPANGMLSFDMIGVDGKVAVVEAELQKKALVLGHDDINLSKYRFAIIDKAETDIVVSSKSNMVKAEPQLAEER